VQNVKYKPHVATQIEFGTNKLVYIFGDLKYDSFITNMNPSSKQIMRMHNTQNHGQKKTCVTQKNYKIEKHNVF
jgi:hypothetical protein